MNNIDFNLINPIFKSLAPSKINDAVREIKTSDYYNSYTRIKTQYKDSFKSSLLKFNNDEKLEHLEYITLIYNLDILYAESYLDEFIEKLLNDKNLLGDYYKLFRPFLYYLYNSENIEVKRKSYKALKVFSERLKAREQYKFVVRSIRRYDNFEEYLNNIEKKISKIKEEDDVSDLCVKYYLYEEDGFFLENISSVILKNYDRIEFFDKFMKYIGSVSLKRQKNIFKNILNSNLKSKNNKQYIDLWFIEMEKILGDPYNLGNTRYDDFKIDCLLYYRKWKNESILKKCLEEDTKKLIFYMQYINCIFRVTYSEKLRNSLIIEFKDHIFIETNDSKHTLFIYKKEIYDIDKLRFICANYNKKQSNSIFKDKSKIEKMIILGDDYFNILDEELKFRGYIKQLD